MLISDGRPRAPIFTPPMTKHPFSSLLSVASALLSSALISPILAAPVPPSDNTSAPYMGVYEWGFATKANLDRIAVAADWLARRQLWGEEFAPTDSWESIECPDWLLGPAAAWVRQDPSRVYILSIGLLPGPVNGSGPATGSGAGLPVSLSNGALGYYNSYFQTLAENLVRNGLASNTIIRLGWEFNGTWYAWKADTDAKALDYANYWKQIVTTMRAVPGAANLKFCWNGAIGWTNFPMADAYPGDEYVDYIGVDVYDQSWAANSYPYPANATAAQIQTCQQNAWNDINADGSTHGITWWRNFAATHAKPLAIPEWGLCVRSDGHGGLDNPYFVQQMYNLIQDPENGIFFHVYFDVQAGDGHHQVTPQNGFVTEFPNAAALLRRLFGYFPYADSDVGAVGVSGTSTIATPRQMSVSGAGTGSVAGGTSDQFHYLARPLGGDGEISVKLVTPANGASAQSFVMLRESASANACYAAIGVTNGSCWFQARAAAGGAAVREASSAAANPQWLALRRAGDRITAFTSADGTNWSFAGTHSIAMGANVLLGLGVASGSSGALATASFDLLDQPVTVTVDDTDAAQLTVTGSWTASTSSYNYYKSSYLTDGNASKGSKSILFTPNLPAAGTYAVSMMWPGGTNRAASVPVSIIHASGTSTVTVNEQNDGNWYSLGAYQFSAGSAGGVRISNAGTSGYVIADAVRFVAVPPREVVIDNADSAHMTFTGSWTPSTALAGYIDSEYLHDNNSGKGAKAAAFKPSLSGTGLYRLYMSWVPYSNRATNVPVVVTTASGTQSLTVNQQQGGPWTLIGTFTCSGSAKAQVSNAGTNGYVAIDAFRWEAAADVAP